MRNTAGRRAALCEEQRRVEAGKQVPIFYTCFSSPGFAIFVVVAVVVVVIVVTVVVIETLKLRTAQGGSRQTGSFFILAFLVSVSLSLSLRNGI